MDKRYQVFVSSTFVDLKDERSNVIQTLMEMDCFPAGMELFPALDEEQFEFIKKVIDDSDYYLLIIGGRYGSLSETGISYTEMEFDYAIEQGIKVIVLVHASPEKLAVEKVEMNSEAQEKLQAFKIKATTDRLVKYWSDAKELPGLVALSLPKTIKTYPAVGWVRASEAIDNTDLLKQLNELRQEKDNLEKQVQELQKNKNEKLDLAQGDDEILIRVNYRVSSAGIVIPKHLDHKISWNELLSFIVPKILYPFPERAVNANLVNYISSKYPSNFQSVDISLNSFEKIKIQLLALEYIELVGEPFDIFWVVTSDAQKKLVRTMAITKTDESFENENDS